MDVDNWVIPVMLECWPIRKVIYNYDGSLISDGITGGMTMILNPVMRRDKTRVYREFTNLVEASNFTYTEMNKAKQTINAAMTKIEFVFTDNTSISEYISLSPNIASQFNNPGLMLNIILNDKIMKIIHQRLKDREEIASEKFLEQFGTCMIKVIDRFGQTHINDPKKLADNLLSQVAQSQLGKVIVEKHASNRNVSFENGRSVGIGDPVLIEKIHWMTKKPFQIRGKVLSIHDEHRAFRVRTRDGISMFRYQNLVFLEEFR